MKLVVVVPHFAPDTAPTGTIATRLTEELAGRGHEIEVITALPWYREHRVEPEFAGHLVRREDTPWGRIIRVHPWPTEDKRNLVRRAAAFGGFTVLAAAYGQVGDRVDGVLAVSPPLTLGLAGWLTAARRGRPFVFNIQDVFPDVAVELGMLENARAVAGARRLERFCYERADAVTVLSGDLKDNISGRVHDPSKIRVIPNFVDTQWIVPSETENGYRAEFGLSNKKVVMYAGNVGLSQSLDLVVDAARALAASPDVVFVVNGQGAARADLRHKARDLPNLRFVDIQPLERLPEVLAAADVHVVPLKKGLARSSVPSKTFSILAAGRPIVASVDAGSEIARILERSGAGLAVEPGDPTGFIAAIRKLIEDPEAAATMGLRGRTFIQRWASPAAVAEAYESLFTELRATASGR